MNFGKLGMVALSALTLGLMACGGEDIVVTGEVTSAAAVSGPISLEFFEIASDATRESVHTAELAQLGEFNETVTIDSESKLLVRALVDQNADKACNDGELWDEQELTPKEDGTVDKITLALDDAACPVAAAPAP